jgi:protein-L-isoaspartate(D-aspartate) O-methyltransferase
MVERQIVARGIKDPNVLSAMLKVPRHLFVPSETRELAYADTPLRLAHGQTISQPYIVAIMSELARLKKPCKVLEIGTGSGYQAAVLAELGCKVYSIEIIEPLSQQAQKTLTSLGHKDIFFRVGDGYQGWPEQAPFDAIVVTAAPPSVPPPLKQQLAIGGRLVIPVGSTHQELQVITRGRENFLNETIFGVVFVPMTGQADQLRLNSGFSDEP